MVSFAGRRPSRSWTVEECATFAARREFELLKLLATDKKALATARRLGAFHPQPQPPSVADGAGQVEAAPQPAAAAAAAAKAAPDSRGRRRRAARCARPARPPEYPQPQPHPPTAAVAVAAGHSASVAAPTPQVADASSVKLSSRKRRSAARSGRHHAAIKWLRFIRSRTLAVVFALRLRRRARLRRDLQELSELSDVEAHPTASKRGRGSSDGSDSDGSSSSQPDCEQCGQRLHPSDGWLADTDGRINVCAPCDAREFSQAMWAEVSSTRSSRGHLSKRGTSGWQQGFLLR